MTIKKFEKIPKNYDLWKHVRLKDAARPTNEMNINKH